MKKKFLLFIAIISVLACMLVISVSAAEPSYKDGEWIYAADGTTKLAIRDTEGNPLIWYMNGEELKYVRADQTDDTQAVYVKYKIEAGGSGFDADHTPEKCIKDIDIYDNGVQIEGATINSQLVLFNMEKLDVDALNGWLWGNKGGCCLLLRGIVFPSTLKYIGTEGFTNHRVVQMWNLENTKFEWYNPSNSAPFSNRYLTQEATNYTIKFPDTLTMNPSVQYTLIKTVIFSPNSTVANANQTLRECKNLEYVYMPAANALTGFNGEGVRDTTNFILCFTGDAEQAQALIDNSGNDWGHNNHLKDNRTSIISYETYLSDKETYDNATNKIYIVYDYNFCEAFYDNNHIGEKSLAYVDYDKDGNEIEGQKFLSKANICVNCTRCNQTSVVGTYDRLFKSIGFSYSTNAVMQGFAINHSAMADYQAFYKESTITFGIVAASATIVTDGKILDAEKKAQVDFTQRKYDIFEMKISNISEENKGKSFFLCAYVTIENETYYLNNGTSSTDATDFAITYNSVSGDTDNKEITK